MRLSKQKLTGVFKTFLSLAMALLFMPSVYAVDSTVPSTKTSTYADEPEVMPEFPGGMDALMTYLGEELTYPEKAKKAKAEGTVYVNFVVSKDGAVSKVSVAKGVSQELYAEAVRVVKAMPKWTPGEQDGQAVAVQMTLPVSFRL